MGSLAHFGSSCLIVEDEPLIGMDLEAELAASGFEVRWAGSLQGALAMLQTAAPNVAVIDFMLRGTPCTGLARELKRRRIPFVVHSGWVGGPDLPPDFQGVPWLDKPADVPALVRALDASLGAAA